MRFSIITPNFNGAAFLEQTIVSVLAQRQEGIDLEYIVIDGGSTDGSLAIIEKFRDSMAHLVVEKDNGPASAINKGLALATGDVVAWLNADDVYYPGALERVKRVVEQQDGLSLCFGRCPIIDEQGNEIRRFITAFKEFFFPISSRFTLQCINYISQPAMFFTREAMLEAGKLREDLVAAWDYDFLLRLWRRGRGVVVPGKPLSAFRWHATSISGRQFKRQFDEELAIAMADSGRLSLQSFIHQGVRLGIIGVYSLLATMLKTQAAKRYQ